ncbi:unnamed protein product, partial [marine sediment metagenome]
HVGVTGRDELLRKRISEFNGRVQYVVSAHNYKTLQSFVDFYGCVGIPIKLFIDFYARGMEKEMLELSVSQVIDNNPGLDIQTRYTGTQENRGRYCDGCIKKCITLKALWVAPDGQVSPCPQGGFVPFEDELVEIAFGEHRKESQYENA